jgi:hypothetical protein
MVDLTVSPADVPLGQIATLRWKVVGLGVNVTGVQLASQTENGLCMIEGTSAEGTRQMIFGQPGVFTFTLAATFSDGTRRRKGISLAVGG